jgi:DNA-binding LacI/PurR family transcriptional regulator
MQKSSVVAQIIQKRIVNGDHRLQGLPSERRLAEDLGMSRTTVRSAVQMLVRQGVLVRQNNGRLDVGGQSPAGAMRTIGLVLPVGNSADFDLWREAAGQALEGHDASLRPVSYTHWGDPFLADAIKAFDGVFFLPRAQAPPGWLLTKLADAGRPVVVLDQDWTDAGLPSVKMFPPKSERRLFDHLLNLGHRRIDCLNVQGETDVIRDRIGVWHEYLEEKFLSGQLRSQSGGSPAETAYRLTQQALSEGNASASALFCTTGIAAIGAMRALEDAKLVIGRDVSVCTVNDEGLGRFLHKSLTSLENPPRAQYLGKVVEWMFSGKSWSGPLLVQPPEVPMFIGESTGPAPKPKRSWRDREDHHDRRLKQ